MRVIFVCAVTAQLLHFFFMLRKERSGTQLQVPVGGAQRESGSRLADKKSHIYWELLVISETASFVFLMEHVQGRNCHVIA